MLNAPPKLARKLLLGFLRDDLREEVEGDLEERFNSLAKHSPRRAKLNYWFQVFNYLRPFALRRSKFYSITQYGMYSSYLKIGSRHLRKNLGYSSINIGGLAMGMAVSLLIGMWVYDELNYDTYHKNYDHIAQVMRNGTLNGETFTTPYQPLPLAEELRSKYGASFSHVVSAMSAGDHILSYDDKKSSFSGTFIDNEGPEMFSLDMKTGTLNGLKDMHSVLLSESLAKVLFGDADPMNKLVKIDNVMDVKVTGVYADFPHNTELRSIDFFAPLDLFIAHNEWTKGQGFKNNFLQVYAQIAPTTTFDKATATVRNAIVDNVRDDAAYVAVNPEIFLHPMSKWHLKSEFKNGAAESGLIRFVWLFGIVGAFVLLLACINFMNLSTARSEKRAKEVGIRKVMGSVRRQLIQQFFSESFLVVIIAFAISLLIVFGSLNWFNGLSGKEMAMPWTNEYFWAVCGVFIAVTGFLAGSYPAIYLSSFQPAKVLKGVLRSGRLASLPRRALVVVQFTVSVSLIAGTIIVYRQIQHAKNRPIGYSREGLIMIQMTSIDFADKLEVLRNELKNTGKVVEVAESTGPLTGIWSSNGGFNWKGKNPDFQTEFATISVTPEYGKTVGWEFVKGRDFSRDLASDAEGLVITESAAKIMNLEDPIGEIVRWGPGWRPEQEFKIIGVIHDVVMQSPFITPMPAIYFQNGPLSYMTIRINPTETSTAAVEAIRSVFTKVIPSVPLDYKFVDQEYALKFADEERIGKLATVFAVLAIAISCLGLFGLASFVAEQRTKEIGIRKISGASVFSLWKLLSRDFVVLVTISCVFSIPLAYYLLHDWLLQYDYRTEISWWIFVMSGGGAIIVILLTVSYQAIRAASMSPVKSLRSE